MHCWIVINYNFKSNIIFYNVPGNNNEKMTHRIYINFIFDSILKSWLKRKNEFVLKKDDDSKHDTNKTRNIVKKWKEDHDLKHFFNCAQSFDLASIEKFWQLIKQHIRKYPHWDDDSLMKLINEEWAQITHEFINEKVRSMLKRLKEMIALREQ